jgi:hypothetical protein
LRLILILLLGLILRLTWAFVQPATDSAIDALPDQREYLSLARNLLHLHRLQFDDPRFQQTIYAYRLPGYPAFVAACGGSIRVVRVVQSVIDASVVLAVYGIARRMGTTILTAEIAAAFVAVNPFMTYFSGAILTETLFTASMTWGVWAIGRKPSPTRSAAFDAVVVIAVLLRPTAVVLLPLIAFGTNGGLALRAKKTVVTLFAVALALLPWAFRNHLLLDHWIFTTTNDGVTLYDGFSPAATGASDQRFFDQMPAERSMSEYDRSQSLRRRAIDWAIQNPAGVVILSAKKILRGWSPVPLSQDFGKPVYRLIAAGYAVPFDVAVLGGLLFAQLTRPQKWLLVLPAIGVTAGMVLSVGSMRYVIPAEPALAVLAATAIGTKERTNDHDPREK